MVVLSMNVGFFVVDSAIDYKPSLRRITHTSILANMPKFAQSARPSMSKRAKRAKPAKLKSRSDGEPVCILLVDSSCMPPSLMLARDAKGKFQPIGGKYKAGENPFAAANDACHKLLGVSPPSVSVLGSVTIKRSRAIVFVCSIDGEFATRAPLHLERVPVYDHRCLSRLQIEDRLHNKLKFGNRDELERLSALAASMPSILHEDLLTPDEELAMLRS
jgi:hypothetical protein